ncbi:MAG: peptidylprolyl isomerase [Proteobacteria bacterium]|jgi:FKBP-type peptidyl-prolyl cis-trans isomerase SlyD|nr:peptidylprolyl isomerase [Pseudomonadota bacterium]
MSEIANGTVVSFHYILTDDSGAVLDSSHGRAPMDYLHGAGNIVPGLEKQLLTHVVGDEFDAHVPPEEGYGLPQGPGPQAMPRSAFPADFELAAGMHFVAKDPEGNSIGLWIASLDEENVMVDNNHPLAGQTLHFAVKVEAIRDATPSELEHGHPHGPHDGC